MAQVLIDRGANVNKIDNEEKSVLMVQNGVSLNIVS